MAPLLGGGDDGDIVDGGGACTGLDTRVGAMHVAGGLSVMELP